VHDPSGPAGAARRADLHDAGEFSAAVTAAAATSDVVGIVVAGNGRGFCSGLDVAALTRRRQGRQADRRWPRANCGAVQLPAGGARADDRRRQRRLRRRWLRAGRAVRPALRIPGRLLHHRLLPAMAAGRARDHLGPAPPAGHRARPRPAVVLTPGERRRGRHAGLVAPAALASLRRARVVPPTPGRRRSDQGRPQPTRADHSRPAPTPAEAHTDRRSAQALRRR
jgi:hypothetical protein